MKKNRSPKPDRKRRIVEAAIQCFGKSGVSHTRMNEIATRAGVDQPLIHYYFPTLDSLYNEVTLVILEDLKQASLAGLGRIANDPVKLMTSYIRAPFDWSERKPEYFSLWIYFYYLASVNPAFASLNHTIRSNGRDRIAVMVYTGIEKGVFKAPKGGTVANLALNIQGLITGNTVMAATEGQHDWARFREETVRMVLHWLAV